MLINLATVSESVLQTLKTSQDLVIHSVFDSGVNVQADDRLIFLGRQEGPSALAVEPRVIPAINLAKVGDKLQYDHNRLHLPQQGISFDLSQAQVLSYHLDPGKILPYTSDKVVRLILGYDFMTGFDVTIQVLLDTLVYKFEYNQLDYLKYLFGRGKGLTPSGDDVIMGLLAYHHVMLFLDDFFIEELKTMIELKTTTDISLNYLKDSLNGESLRYLESI